MRKKNEESLRKTFGFSKVNDKRIHHFEANAALYKGNSTGPVHKSYSFIKDWTETLPKQTGIFLKKRRHTFTEEAIDISKKLPAPSKYPSQKFGDLSV